ncbi:MAG TPA: hypothetical protein VN306_15765 [Mycobacterium sp.]|nr:hypothetical protein [Mycobacterium sp.]
MIEGFYDWGPGVVVTADCLGRAYQTAVAGRQLIVVLPSFDGSKVPEPPLRYKPPDGAVNLAGAQRDRGVQGLGGLGVGGMGQAAAVSPVISFQTANRRVISVR